MTATHVSDHQHRFDVVSLGEVMLRMAPPRFERLRRTRRLDVEVAGAQLNVCANLARLGKRAAFVSKLPDNALGLLARDTCLSYGVNMDNVQLVAGARMGLNFLEFTATPRAPVTIFDRAASAASTMEAADFDWDSIVDGAAIAHSDGIFPGLTPGCRESVRSYFQAAKRHGCMTSFDMNYREHVWTPTEARSVLGELLPLIDIVATSPTVSELLFGFKGSDEAIAQHYIDTYGCATAVVTRREMEGVLRGAWSSLARQGGATLHGRRFTFEIVDRYGTGDAFLAGLLFGVLEQDLAYGLDFGNASCALAHTLEGDVAHLSRTEVEAILDGDPDLRPRR